MLLFTRNIRTRRTSTKLLNKFLESFSIVERVNTSAYRLDLPIKYERLYLVFYVSLLKLYYSREDVVLSLLIDLENEEHFKVV